MRANKLDLKGHGFFHITTLSAQPVMADGESPHPRGDRVYSQYFSDRRHNTVCSCDYSTTSYEGPYCEAAIEFSPLALPRAI